MKSNLRIEHKEGGKYAVWLQIDGEDIVDLSMIVADVQLEMGPSQAPIWRIDFLADLDGDQATKTYWTSDDNVWAMIKPIEIKPAERE